MDAGGRPAPCECVDVAQLAMGVGGQTVVAVRRGQVGAVLQEDRALVVVAAHGMHQGRAELEQADGLEVLVARAVGSVGGPAQALQPGVDRAGGRARRGLTRAAMRPRLGGGTPGGASASRRRPALRSAAVGSIPSSRRNSASVSSTCSRAASYRPAATRLLTSRTWAPSSNTARRTPSSASGSARSVVAGRQAAKHLGAHEGVDETGDALTAHQQPRVQLRAAPRVDALEQVTGPFEVERAGLDVGHVETGGGREAGHDRVTDEHVGRAERPAEPGEAPAERAERVVGRREQLGAELAPAQWTFGQQDAGQQRP